MEEDSIYRIPGIFLKAGAWARTTGAASRQPLGVVGGKTSHALKKSKI
jgi:hypothetical protein